MDRQIILVVVICLAAACFVMALTYLVNMYFVRSIIAPLGSITDTAKRIASGYYGIQLERSTMTRSATSSTPSTICPPGSARTSR